MVPEGLRGGKGTGRCSSLSAETLCGSGASSCPHKGHCPCTSGPNYQNQDGQECLRFIEASSAGGPRPWGHEEGEEELPQLHVCPAGGWTWPLRIKKNVLLPEPLHFTAMWRPFLHAIHFVLSSPQIWGKKASCFTLHIQAGS